MDPFAFEVGTHEGNFGFWAMAFDYTILFRRNPLERQYLGVEVEPERVFFKMYHLPEQFRKGSSVFWVGHVGCCPETQVRIFGRRQKMHPNTLVSVWKLEDGRHALVAIIPERENFIPVNFCCTHPDFGLYVLN